MHERMWNCSTVSRSGRKNSEKFLFQPDHVFTPWPIWEHRSGSTCYLYQNFAKRGPWVRYSAFSTWTPVRDMRNTKRGMSTEACIIARQIMNYNNTGVVSCSNSCQRVVSKRKCSNELRRLRVISVILLFNKRFDTYASLLNWINYLTNCENMQRGIVG